MTKGKKKNKVRIASKSSSKFSRLRTKICISFWVGLFGGLLATINSCFSFYDRIAPTMVEIVAVQPVAIRARVKLMGGGLQLTEGAGLILRIRNKSPRVVMVEGVDIVGKIYLYVNEYLGYTDVTGRTMDEIEKEMNNKRPYWKVSYASSLTGYKSPMRLDPGEERFIKFTFRDPTHFSSSEYCSKDAIGYEFNNTIPGCVLTYADTGKIFDFQVNHRQNRFFPVRVKKELLDGTASFYVRISGGSFKVDSERIKDLTTVLVDRWNNNSAQDVFYGNFMQFNEVVVTP